MSADKHPAGMLADTGPARRGLLWHEDVDGMLRRIPALEKLAAERLAQMEADRKQALQWRDERDALRAEVAALRAQEPLGWKRVPEEQGRSRTETARMAPESITGWKLNYARHHPEHAGVWEIGHLSDEDWFSPVVVVDTGNYDQDDQAQPLATAILAALAFSTDGHRVSAAIGDALMRVAVVLSANRAPITNSSSIGIGEFNGCGFRLMAIPGARSLPPEWARVLPATATPSGPKAAGG